MIVFGWNSFKLDSFKPSKVNLPAEMDAEITIQKKQKYFHLFWIPFFPIGQVWIIKKKGDSDSYEPTAAMNQYLNTLDLKHKTPWYTFALPLLAMAVGTIYFIHSEIKSYQWKQQHQEDLVRKNESFLSVVGKGEPYTYFTLKDKNNKTTYLKVIGSDVDALTCVLSQTDHCEDYSNCMLEAFDTNEQADERILDTVNISKADLIGSYNAKEENNFAPKQLVRNYDAMNVTEFKIIDYPVFTFGGASYKEGKYMGVFKNIGAPVTQIKIQPGDYRKDNTLFLDTTAFPKKISSNGNLVLTGIYKDAEPFLATNVIFVKENNKLDTCALFLSGVRASLKNEKNR